MLLEDGDGLAVREGPQQKLWRRAWNERVKGLLKGFACLLGCGLGSGLVPTQRMISWASGVLVLFAVAALTVVKAFAKDSMLGRLNRPEVVSGRTWSRTGARVFGRV